MLKKQYKYILLLILILVVFCTACDDETSAKEEVTTEESNESKTSIDNNISNNTNLDNTGGNVDIKIQKLEDNKENIVLTFYQVESEDNIYRTIDAKEITIYNGDEDVLQGQLELRRGLYRLVDVSTDENSGAHKFEFDDSAFEIDTNTTHTIEIKEAKLSNEEVKKQKEEEERIEKEQKEAEKKVKKEKEEKERQEKEKKETYALFKKGNKYLSTQTNIQYKKFVINESLIKLRDYDTGEWGWSEKYQNIYSDILYNYLDNVGGEILDVIGIDSEHSLDIRCFVLNVPEDAPLVGESVKLNKMITDYIYHELSKEYVRKYLEALK